MAHLEINIDVLSCSCAEEGVLVCNIVSGFQIELGVLFSLWNLITDIRQWTPGYMWGCLWLVISS